MNAAAAYVPPAVDWQRLALDLRAARVPLSTASRAIGANPGFVSALSRGEIVEPKFTEGVALLNLHSDKCGPDRTASLVGTL